MSSSESASDLTDATVTFVTSCLQSGFLATCPYFGGEVFVTGGLGALLADTCRFCDVSKARITEIPCDWKAEWTSRNRDTGMVCNVMEEMAGLPISQRSHMETATGILYQPENPLYNPGLQFDPITQVLQPQLVACVVLNVLF